MSSYRKRKPANKQEQQKIIIQHSLAVLQTRNFIMLMLTQFLCHLYSPPSEKDGMGWKNFVFLFIFFAIAYLFCLHSKASLKRLSFFLSLFLRRWPAASSSERSSENKYTDP